MNKINKVVESKEVKVKDVLKCCHEFVSKQSFLFSLYFWTLCLINGFLVFSLGLSYSYMMNKGITFASSYEVPPRIEIPFICDLVIFFIGIYVTQISASMIHKMLTSETENNDIEGIAKLNGNRFFDGIVFCIFMVLVTFITMVITLVLLSLNNFFTYIMFTFFAILMVVINVFSVSTAYEYATNELTIVKSALYVKGLMVKNCKSYVYFICKAILTIAMVVLPCVLVYKLFLVNVFSTFENSLASLFNFNSTYHTYFVNSFNVSMIILPFIILFILFMQVTFILKYMNVKKGETVGTECYIDKKNLT
ncbi:MAG: hypothetical protein ACK5LV_00435 [Lachnospirales bacterium]